MTIEIVTVTCRSDNYAYLVHDERSGQTALIDAVEEAPILAALDEHDWELDAIWLTHHHDDHIVATDPLRKRFNARVIGHADDAKRLPKLDVALHDGDPIALGQSHAMVCDVSGHTLGHIAFHFPDEHVAFTADSLMALGCGRIFEGTHAMMWRSLQKMMAWPRQTLIYSGHNYGKANGKFALTIEPDNLELRARIARIEAADAAGEPIVPVTLAEELATNPFLRASVPSVKAAVGLDGADDATVFAEIRRRKDNF